MNSFGGPDDVAASLFDFLLVPEMATQKDLEILGGHERPSPADPDALIARIRQDAQKAARRSRGVIVMAAIISVTRCNEKSAMITSLEFRSVIAAL